MAAEDFARALIRLDNPYVRREIERGDFADLERAEFRLTDEERELLRSATEEVPREEQVAVTLLDEDPRRAEPGEGGPGRGWGYWPLAIARAIEYIRREGLRDPGVQASFIAWQDLRGDDVP
jgi:hypothetical protein